MSLKNPVYLAVTVVLAALLTCSACAQQSKLPFAWPPVLNQEYPDLTLSDHRGREVRLSSYKGKILLIEPIGMSCPACQAFCGANRKNPGPFGSVRPQAGLPAIDDYLAGQGISPSDPGIIFIQLLLYSPAMKAPTPAEASAWARHFDIDKKPNHQVLVGNKNLINQASYNMIPGFQLVDRNFVLRSDSTGHHPRNDLYRHLIPLLKRISGS